MTLPRVLVVDDDQANRHVLLSMLKVLGAPAEAVSTASEALEKMSTSEYDLVLMDIVLPGISGTEAAKQIRETYGNKPVIVGITALSPPDESYQSAGIERTLRKPLRLSEISRTIQDHSVVQDS